MDIFFSFPGSIDGAGRCGLIGLHPALPRENTQIMLDLTPYSLHRGVEPLTIERAGRG